VARRVLTSVGGIIALTIAVAFGGFLALRRYAVTGE
jgi:hypothetical protein